MYSHGAIVSRRRSHAKYFGVALLLTLVAAVYPSESATRTPPHLIAAIRNVLLSLGFTRAR